MASKAMALLEESQYVQDILDHPNLDSQMDNNLMRKWKIHSTQQGMHELLNSGLLTLTLHLNPVQMTLTQIMTLRVMIL